MCTLQSRGRCFVTRRFPAEVATCIERSSGYWIFALIPRAHTRLFRVPTSVSVVLRNRSLISVLFSYLSVSGQAIGPGSFSRGSYPVVDTRASAPAFSHCPTQICAVTWILILQHSCGDFPYYCEDSLRGRPGIYNGSIWEVSGHIKDSMDLSAVSQTVG